MINTKRQPIIYTSLDQVEINVSLFKRLFKHDFMYAVKANNNDKILKEIYNSGCCKFDISSIPEMEKISLLFGKNYELFFLNPIKSTDSIIEAYKKFNCLNYAVDSLDEVYKIYNCLGIDENINLFIRVKVLDENNIFQLNNKFGCTSNEALIIKKLSRQLSYKTSFTFHVGSQCLDVNLYKSAIKEIDKIVDDMDDAISIGGGFPVQYSNEEKNLDYEHFFFQINSFINESKHINKKRILSEPGRILVANVQTLLTQVIARKSNNLYINDGIYGVLFDAGFTNWKYPYSLIENGVCMPSISKNEFSVFGPTCDGIDKLGYKLLLPYNIKTGDFIAFHNIGAYGDVLASSFNQMNERLYEYGNDYENYIKKIYN